MNIIVYLKVKDLQIANEFYINDLDLFETIEEDRIRAKFNNNLIISFIKENSQELKIYAASFELKNCTVIFEKIKKHSFNNGGGIFEDFFGEFLSTPISEQFTIIDPFGNKILYFSKK